MQLHVLGSNSSGNCYVLKSTDVTVILECGINFMEVKKALNFNLKNVVACLMTHSHGDHSKYVKDFLKAGIPVYTSQETINQTKVQHHNWKPVEAGKLYNIPSFGAVKPFDVKHDVKCFGYLIRTLDGNTFAFITDTHYVDARLPGLTNLILECNFSDELIDENGTTTLVRNRVRTSHLSLDLCRDFLKKTDLSKVNNIVLVHLSDKNSNAVQFQNEIAASTGKQVHIATPGAVIDFDIRPF